MAEGNTYKVMLIGNTRVGKTMLLSRYCGEEFRQEYVATVGIDYQVKTLNRDGKEYTLQIWDTAGQERYNSITRAYYHGCAGVVVMFDITDDASFTAVQNWFDNVQESAGETPMILVGNKSDLFQDRAISAEDARELVESLGMVAYIETSVKDNVNIEEAFDKLLDAILSRPASPPAAERAEHTVIDGDRLDNGKADGTVAIPNNNQPKCKCIVM